MNRPTEKQRILLSVEVKLGSFWIASVKSGDLNTAKSIDRAIDDIINLRIVKK